MEIHVAFLPGEAGALRGRAAVVIDVIRATTSVLAMLEGGCAEVLIAPTVEAARRYRDSHPDVLLAGEQGGRAPPGFDFGNSPVAFAQAALTGRRVVFATTNGTRAIHAAGEARSVLMGCLRNRTAAARAALAAAETGRGLSLVCSGREGRFSLDDAYTAGAIVDALIESGGSAALELTDAALAARRLYRDADSEALFRETRAGRHVIEIGLGDDLLYCAKIDQSTMVPRLGERVRVVES